MPWILRPAKSWFLRDFGQLIICCCCKEIRLGQLQIVIATGCDARMKYYKIAFQSKVDHPQMCSTFGYVRMSHFVLM